MLGIEYLHKTYTLAKALLGGESVGQERLQKRLEVCRGCDRVTIDDSGEKMKCGICGCRVKGDQSLINLARYEETDDYGCKHDDGSRWKAAGC